MKITALLSLFLATLAPAEIRDWTSADGARTFKAKVTSFEKDTLTVTMDVDGQEISFHTDKLSEADREFLAQWDGKVAPSPTIAELLAKDKVMRLEGEKFVASKVEKTPKYYLLYYSASW